MLAQRRKRNPSPKERNIAPGVCSVANLKLLQDLLLARLFELLNTVVAIGAGPNKEWFRQISIWDVIKLSRIVLLIICLRRSK